MKKGNFAVWILILAVLIIASGCSNKWVTSGKIAMNSKKYDKAINDFNKALAENPDNAEAHLFIAMCFKEKKEYDKMPAHLDAAEKLETQAKKVEKIRTATWADLFDAGHDNAKNEKYEEAIKDFSIAIIIDPSRYQAYSDFGFVWQKLENIDSSYYYYSEAYKIAPDEKSVIENLARICTVSERFDQAAELYTKLLESEPDNAEAYLVLGDIAMQNNEQATAVDFYEKALAQDSLNCDVWFNVGLVYFQDLDNIEKAISSFKQVLKTPGCEDDINASINLAVALINNNNLDEAVAILETFLEIHPDECSGWDLYTQALLKSGKRNEALDANKKFEECTANK